MVTVVAGPELTAKSGHCLSCVLNDAPATARLIGGDFIEEVISEDSLLSCDCVFLLLVLNFTEVYPSVEREGVSLGKTSESLIDLNLV